MFFNNDKDTSRKYTCFVCGVVHKTQDEFLKHIKETHEEGQEFLTCPQCQTCVRDLKAHFKAKHPHTKLPTGDHRVTVWADSTEKKKRSKRPRKGTMISNKMNGKAMTYRSGFECDVYNCLELMGEVTAYDVEPFKVPYVFKGTGHDYNPDLSVKFTDGSIEIWEVKMSKETDLDVNKAKWAAANQFCKLRGWKFVVITETELHRLQKRLRQEKP